MQQVLNNLLIIGTPTIFENKDSFKGLDPGVIGVNVFHDPQKHIRQYGQVKSVPRRLNKIPMATAAQFYGRPVYPREYGPTPFYYANEWPINMQKGDIVYFHYNTLLPSVNQKTDSMPLFNHRYLETIDVDRPFLGKNEKEHLFKVNFTEVYLIARYTKLKDNMDDFHITMPLECVHRNPKEGDILRTLDGKNSYRRKYISVNGYCMIRPDYESWEDILIPTPSIGADGKPMKDVFGKPIYKPKEQWLATKPSPGEKYLQGFVEIVGNGRIGKEDEVEVNHGDHVYLLTDTDTPLRVDNVNYYRCHYTNIVAKTDKKYIPIGDKDRENITFNTDAEAAMLNLEETPNIGAN